MSELINFYELDAVKALQPKAHNPNYHKHGLKVPFRMVVVGASGSGKSNIVLNLISLCENTFHKIYLFTRDKNEALYEYLELAIPDKEFLEIHEGLDHLKSMDFKKDFFGQSLVIFDDLCLEKDQDVISELYIRGRKMGSGSSKGVSVVYLTQKYTQVPTIIRGNCNYMILKKISGRRDIVEIMKNGAVIVERDTLLRMYNHCINGDDILSFLLIDFNAPSEHQFRHNFTRVMNISFFQK